MSKQKFDLKELRPEHWIEVAGGRYTVNGAMLAELDKKNCTYRKTVKPIPITKEVLLAAGFTSVNGADTEYRIVHPAGGPFGKVTISIYDSTQIRVWKGDNYVGILHCAALHHLQDIYRVLMWEDLPVNSDLLCGNQAVTMPAESWEGLD